jgi:hypothetical protein
VTAKQWQQAPCDGGPSTFTSRANARISGRRERVRSTDGVLQAVELFSINAERRKLMFVSKLKGQGRKVPQRSSADIRVTLAAVGQLILRSPLARLRTDLGTRSSDIGIITDHGLS